MNFLEIKNTQNLADYFGVSYKMLARLTYGPDRVNLYKKFEITKKSGGTRIILSPEPTLKILQRKISEELKNHYQRHDAAFGFVDEYSIVENAEKHIRKKWVLNLDLENFFPSIHFGRVKGLFLKPPFEFSVNVAQWLAQLITFEQILPQGSPSSPIISNMICLSLDRDLKLLSKHYDLTYTRYADDITLSSYTDFPVAVAELIKNGEKTTVTLGEDIVSVINKNGFQINHSKTRLVGRSRRQEVTGVVVNEKCNLPLNYLNIIRGEIGRLRFLENKEQNKLHKVVLGRLGHLKKVVGETDTRYLRLKAKFLGIKISAHTHDEFLFRSIAWIVEDIESGEYGTVYYIDGIGWITAQHVIKLSSIANYKMYHPDAPDSKYTIKLKSNWFDDDIDYVILTSHAKPIIKVVPVTTPIKNGENCFLAGYPNYLKNNSVTIMDAKVTSSQSIFKVLRFVVDKQIFHGMSGGPVLNSKNLLVGIITHGSKDGSDLIVQSAFTSIQLVLDINKKSCI